MEWSHRMLCIAVIIGGVCIYLPKLGLFPDHFIALCPSIIQFPLRFLHLGITNTTANKNKTLTLFTNKEIKKYTNKDIGLYLGLLGKVYDVAKGFKYYGKNGAYHFFTGRDASRAFVTGDFSDSGLVDDVLGLTVDEFLSLDKWVQFYKKEYTFKGKLIGRYYDKTGKPTVYNKRVRKLIKEAKNSREEALQERMFHPGCNVEWKKASGSRVWCSNLSGGIEREWIGVPRQLYDPGSKSYHCACIKPDQLQIYEGKVKEYPECHPDSTDCIVNM